MVTAWEDAAVCLLSCSAISMFIFLFLIEDHIQRTIRIKLKNLERLYENSLEEQDLSVDTTIFNSTIYTL